MKTNSSGILIVSSTFFCLSFLFQIVLCNHVAVKTQELNSVSDQILELKNQISAINQEIYLTSSIAVLEANAKKQGFELMTVSMKNVSRPAIARVF